MKKLLLFVLVLVAISAVAVNCAYAGEGKGGGKGKFDIKAIFDRLDNDPKDGFLSLKEVLASPRVTDKEKATAAFKKCAKDDKLDLEGFKAYMKEMRPEGGRRGGGEKK